MRSLIETAVLITGCGSAICWFASAMWHLPSIKPGRDRELAKVTELSVRLQRIKPVELLGRGADGRHRLAVGVGKICSDDMAHKRSGPDRRRAASD